MHAETILSLAITYTLFLADSGLYLNYSHLNYKKPLFYVSLPVSLDKLHAHYPNSSSDPENYWIECERAIQIR